MKKVELSKNKWLKIERIFWYLLLIMSIISLLTIIPTFMVGGSSLRKPEWKELVITPFYFTMQSNFLALLVSFLVIFNYNKNVKLIRILSIYMITNLIITFFGYWFLLYSYTNKTGIISWIKNLTLHTLTPLLSVMVFILKYYVNNNEKDQKRIWISSFYHLIYPLIWLMLGMILFVVLGSKNEDGIYPFLDFIHNLDSFFIYFCSIAVVYYFLTVFFVWLSNPKKFN